MASTARWMFASLSCPPNTGTVSKGLSSSSEIRSLVSAIERGKSIFYGNCAFEDECTFRPLEGAFTPYNQHVWADVNPYAKLISFYINIFCKNNLGPPSRILSSANALMEKTFHVASLRFCQSCWPPFPTQPADEVPATWSTCPLCTSPLCEAIWTFPNRWVGQDGSVA